MPYLIKETSRDKIVFAREGTGGTMAAFVVMGSIFFLIGVVINIVSTDTGFPFILMRILFPLFGLMAVAAGIAFPGQDKAKNPQLITFDNARGAVIIDMAGDGAQQGYIRYDEIDKFDIYVEARSSSSKGSNRTYYHYHTLIRKKDGGEWFLSRSNTRQKADTILQQLNSQVPLSKTANIQVRPLTTDKLSKDEKIDKTIISWQNKVSIWSWIFTGLFALIFLGIIGSFIYFGEGMGAFFSNAVLGFILIVFFLILYFNTKKLYKDATTRYALTVGRQNLEYNEYAISTDMVKHSQAIPLKDIHSISYTFSPVRQTSISGLDIRTHQQHAEFQSVKNDPMALLKSAISGKDQGLQIKINALNAVECLQLETWLQEVIKKKGVDSVL